ncbi:MAG: hypothetical protein QM776_05820 [Rhodocyclaceae bacterium]
MKLTLDHNVIIDLANGAKNVLRLRELLDDPAHQAYVVEIGASEMRQRGIRPDRYDLFEQLLEEAGIANLPRLMPLMLWGVTFWDHGMWANKEMTTKAKEIEDILFGESPVIDISGESDDSPKKATWLNRICDVHTMWCHLHYGNDSFVTSDRNFHKATKLPRLLAMGAGAICRPEDL